MSGARRRDFVLAIYPFTVGLAYALFESPLSPLEWGVKDIRGRRKTMRAFDAAERLIDRLQPDILLMQDLGRTHKRSARIHRLQRLIEGHANVQALEVHRYNRQQIREVFRPLGAATRYEIAQVIASQVQGFGHRLPPPRKIWKTEASRMGIFDAAALAMTFYAEGDGSAISNDVP